MSNPAVQKLGFEPGDRVVIVHADDLTLLDPLYVLPAGLWRPRFRL
jgi:hypothetical protein